MNDPIPSLAELVRSLRTAKNMTQVDLEDASGVGQNIISNIERGATSQPQHVTLARLAQALNVDLPDLYLAARYARSRAQAETLIVTEGMADLAQTFPSGSPQRRLAESLKWLTPDELEAHAEQIERRAKQNRRRGVQPGPPP